VNQIKSQFLGVILAVLTAVGIISYEKIVKTYSYSAIALCNLLLSISCLGLFLMYQPNSIKDIKKVLTYSTKDVIIFISCYLIVSFIWYYLTLTKNVMVSSLFEIKYIVVLAIIYIVAGEQKLSWNVVVGVMLALSSIYFITK
jgi:hypothetical protein